MKKPEEELDKAINQAGYLQPCFAENARRQMVEISEVILRTENNIDAILSRGNEIPQKAGFIAEEIHAGTYNANAVLEGEQGRAYTDLYEEWKSQKWHDRNLDKYDVPDVVIAKDGEVVHASQLKYNEDAAETAKQLSDPRYMEMDSLIGPEDQIKGTFKNVSDESEPVRTTTISEHAQAKADALEAKGGDETKINGYRNAAEKATDRIESGKASSQPLSREEALEIASGNKKKLRRIEADSKTSSTMQQMGNAAAGAAAMAAILSGSMSVVRYARMAANNEISGKDATIRIICEVAAAAGDSAIKAAAIAGAHSLLARYATRQTTVEIMARQGLKNLLRGNIVTIGVVNVIDALKDLLPLAAGKMNYREFCDLRAKGILSTSAGLAGGSFGSAGGASLATSLGIAEGTLLMSGLTLAGGVAGGIIAGVGLQIAIENGIEKPYRELTENTFYLSETAAALNKVVYRAWQCDLAFDKLRQFEGLLDASINARLEKITRKRQEIQASRHRLDDLLNECEANLPLLEQIRIDLAKDKAQLAESRIMVRQKLNNFKNFLRSK